MPAILVILILLSSVGIVWACHLPDMNQKYIKMRKDVILEGSSQQENKDLINRRNGQKPKAFEVLLISLLKR